MAKKHKNAKSVLKSATKRGKSPLGGSSTSKKAALPWAKDLAKTKSGKQASREVTAARERRPGRAIKDAARVESNIDGALKTLNESIEKRVLRATAFLHSKISTYINIPVEKITGPRGGQIVIRSKPGEYPRKEWSPLRNSLLQDGPVEVEPGVWEGYVGTPLDYGLILETSEKLNRSFLLKGLNDNRTQIEGILGAPLQI